MCDVLGIHDVNISICIQVFMYSRSGLMDFALNFSGILGLLN